MRLTAPVSDRVFWAFPSDMAGGKELSPDSKAEGHDPERAAVICFWGSPRRTGVKNRPRSDFLQGQSRPWGYNNEHLVSQ